MSKKMTITQLLKEAKFIVIKYRKDVSATEGRVIYAPCYEVLGIYDAIEDTDTVVNDDCIVILGW